MSVRPLDSSRRRFLKTGAAALGLAPMAFLRGQEGSPNDEIALGVIGCGGMGRNNMINFLGIEGVRVVAVCDVDARAAQIAKARVDQHYGNQDCKIHADYTDLIATPGLDVVCTATPDHWHARIAIDAANAGLDIYGEKPFTWGLREGRMVVDALEKNRRVWQTGSWQRSKGEFRRFKALIENDTLGKISRIECGTLGGMDIQQHVEPGEVDGLLGKPPKELDWSAWCGPAGEFEYHPLIHPWNWRWHLTFGGGKLLDWVGHHVDIAMWSLGLDRTGPTEVSGTGKPADHPFFNCLVDYEYTGEFADGHRFEVNSRFGGTKFTGENGWIHVNRGSLKASDREMLRNLPEDFDTKPPSHWQDFINCVRSRKQPQSDPEGAHRAASFGQLAIAAIDAGRPLKWDPEAEKVLGDDELAKHPRLGARLG